MYFTVVYFTIAQHLRLMFDHSIVVLTHPAPRAGSDAVDVAAHRLGNTGLVADDNELALDI